MAELALYDNDLEPNFPFDDITPRLTWLRKYLAQRITTTVTDGVPANLAPVLDTVLVFARARTSALHGMEHWSTCREVSSRLNSTLASMSPKAPYFRIELVRRRHAFFIVSTRSPRFDWSRKLTHGDVGRNLDYFAPGHITFSLHPPRGSILFIEKTSLRALSAELIILSVLEDTDVLADMEHFNDAKEALFNDTMLQLGLSYRFKWILNTTAARNCISSTIMSPTPPTPSWWEDNCYFVNGFGFPEIVQEPWPFCSFQSHYSDWWELIQQTFIFMMKYKHVQYWHSSPATASSYWNAIKILFGRIKSTTELNSSQITRTLIMNDFISEMEILVQQAETSTYCLFSDSDPHAQENPTGLRSLSSSQRLVRNVWGTAAGWFEVVIRYLWQRHKLRQPLIRKGPWAPPSGSGMFT